MNEDKVVEMLIDHSERLSRLEENMVTKTEFHEFIETYSRGQDKMMQILLRLDQERVFTNERLKKLEDKVNNKFHITV